MQMHEFMDVVRHYATFTGRARRLTFWMFILTGILLAAGLALIDEALGLRVSTRPDDDGLLVSLLTLALLLPTIAVTVRRLHDTGRSGSNLWLLLIPLFGWLTLLAWLSEDGQPRTNKWGADPMSATGRVPTPAQND
ncbi:DUF805 domain-containing protein [Deinococcus sedimenti]|uniref:DUF805 domain-containing protein n=1 Tax=Deinococcus sedimenti TaxID=1867090 RepID=A0ABQ2S1W1_9DEIO|nr:DUF805 domain-containing protein [Deinococcus sedimenti]GGR89970.1 DUF805 domain-containing protein [Deinococcus sedimenti]